MPNVSLPSTSSYPLADLKVVELATVLAGPAVGMFFAELGAQVLKVENLSAGQGDVTRSWRLASESADKQPSAYYCSVNWGKQLLDIDFRSAIGKESLLKLIAASDILLVNFRPGDALRYGLDDLTCRAQNPGLIYASLTGYGESDARAGLDVLVQATSGFLSMTGTPEGELCRLPVALIDLLAAHQLKEGILLALLEREKTGKGQKVEVNLFQSAIASLANQASNFFHSGRSPKPMGSEHPNIVPYGLIATTADDVSLVLALGSDKQFIAFCDIVAPELARQTKFSSNQERVKHREELNALLKVAVRRQLSETLLAACREQKLLVDRVRTVGDALADPLAEQMILKNEAGEKGAVRSVAFKLSASPTSRDDLSEPI